MEAGTPRIVASVTSELKEKQVTYLGLPILKRARLLSYHPAKVVTFALRLQQILNQFVLASNLHSNKINSISDFAKFRTYDSPD
jgi:hypothetical protein